MNIKNAAFLKSCPAIKDLLQYSYPEFAFMGRSNVGKSSLINMFTGRRELVKVGSRPGVTRAINLFLINEAISIADLPGFGYAKLPKELRKTFMPLIKEYIKARTNLKLVFLLIDIRRSPDNFEQELITLLSNNNIPTAIIITKSDKLSKNKRIGRLKDIARELDIHEEALFISSSKTREGKRDILNLIKSYVK